MIHHHVQQLREILTQPTDTMVLDFQRTIIDHVTNNLDDLWEKQGGTDVLKSFRYENDDPRDFRGRLVT